MRGLYDRCELPCVREGCDGKCQWIYYHNTDDGLHLCCKHIKDYEDELEEKESGYRGADAD